MTLILPHAQGVASTRPALTGTMIERRRGGSRMFAPIAARLARTPLPDLTAIKVSR